MRRLLASLSNGNLDSLSEISVGTDDVPIGIGPGVFGTINKAALLQGVQYDAWVANLAGRAAYNGAAAGFSVLVIDIGDGRSALYFKNSATSGDWSAPSYVTGPVGPGGPYTEITVGPTTTLPAGSDATVTPVVIDSDTVRLDFGLPRGLDGTGTGDVVGPASSVAGRVAVFSGTTGKVISDGGILLSDLTRMGRNLIINGQGRVNQRTYASGTATTAANQYTLDRWRVVVSGQSLAFTGNASKRTMTAPAGGVEQVIEGLNVEGGTYTINWTGSATCTVDGTARAKGSSFTLTANTNVTVRFTGGTFTDVQLESGSVPSIFERLLYEDELRICKRYYQSVDLLINVQVGGVQQDLYGMVNLPVEMRGTPTVVPTNGTFVNCTLGTATAGNRVASFYVLSVSSGIVYCYITSILNSEF